jgi:hypothetical protein
MAIRQTHYSEDKLEHEPSHSHKSTDDKGLLWLLIILGLVAIFILWMITADMNRVRVPTVIENNTNTERIEEKETIEKERIEKVTETPTATTVPSLIPTDL